MADAVQVREVDRAIDELRARVRDAGAVYGEIPAVQRLVNDIERLRIDVRDLDNVPLPAATHSPVATVRIDDTPADPSMWADADDEGIGGFHGPHR